MPSWPQYITHISTRFGDLCDDPMSELVSLHQGGSVQEYLDEFEAILARLTLPKEHVVSIFLAGLNNQT